MMAKTYTYDPAKINENGKDRMRFELGDIMVEGGADTCALTDEEYNAIIGHYPNKWKKAKLCKLPPAMIIRRPKKNLLMISFALNYFTKKVF